jgi:hypothetical protein
MTIDTLSFIILALAAFRLTYLITTDVILDSFRDKIWTKFPPSTKLGYLITCNWCSGFWVSIFVVILYICLPQVTLVVSLVLAISALVGVLSSWLER